MTKEEYEKELIQRILARIEQYGGNEYLSSIILTGSFGRGEPTYVIDDKGSLCLKSDIEIALIYPRTAKKRNVNQLIESVQKEFSEDLNLMPLVERRIIYAYNFNYSVKMPKYKTIFTYDLFNGSYTIWGTDFIEKKSVGLSEVDLYEAKRLVANRIGELSYIGINTKDNKEYLNMQWKGKLVLAIASAWLICEGAYVSSYHGQYEKICEKKRDIEKIIGQNFIEDYQKVFQLLRENGKVYDVADEKLRNYVKKINRYFIEKDLRFSRVNSSGRVVKYFIKYVKAGINYGIIQFEDNILQKLIDAYYKNTDELSNVADIWYNVLY